MVRIASVSYSLTGNKSRLIYEKFLDDSNYIQFPVWDIEQMNNFIWHILTSQSHCILNQLTNIEVLCWYRDSLNCSSLLFTWRKKRKFVVCEGLCAGEWGIVTTLAFFREHLLHLRFAESANVYKQERFSLEFLVVQYEQSAQCK